MNILIRSDISALIDRRHSPPKKTQMSKQYDMLQVRINLFRQLTLLFAQESISMLTSDMTKTSSPLTGYIWLCHEYFGKK